ncbi:putative gtpase-activating protein gyp3 protein [Phaeoacremonium minimum UCRPA7]|uniref:Putative gtpase-activating protein gyp3 protein n=1 Tax=Phaeoacremonium minimum (strain UCR-PA7) TaxID=1286976 RepID=R8BX29_PHAM7|nr:putative gtpase-activating protein gyp3 protein [Phaeoacremonium minimum UCRPA7]EOO03913.1 putative gtpase-activating protein gyp3 protein [Phaeoacremonium minimum UCRPA7]
MNEEELRSSYRSQLTSSTAQGSLFTSSAHERSSVLTKSSSVTSASLNAYYWGPNGTGAHDENLSADDVLGMYEKGFADDSAMEDNDRHSVNDEDTQEIDMGDDTTNLDAFRPATTASNTGVRDRLLEAMSEPLLVPSNSLAIPGADGHVVRDSGAFFRNSGLPSSVPNDIGMSLAEEAAKAEKRREQGGGRTRWNHSIDDEEFALKHDSAKMLEQQTDDSLLILEPELPRRNSARINTPSPSPSQPQIEIRELAVKDDRSSAPSITNLVQGAHEQDDPDSRDRYGFKKQNQYITREQYDQWNSGYSEYLARRRKKWVQYLKESGLMTDDPGRFPPPSAKTKRFIRKGIPPEWRGAAWFYYAGGPAILAKHSGVYDELVRRADRGEVKTIAKDDIERDLYRTFPDNVRFRRPPPPGINGKATPETPLHSRNPSTQSANPTPRLPGTEPEIIASLRRVLSAFAIYNPRIGYCQSLNFLAGLLLLFVETEEQAFWLLNIITRVYLPGTHEMSLEGSKVDLGVLMSELRTCLPGVWTKISDDGSGKKSRRKDKGAPIGDDSLPPVTLALTAWFMSCFIGTLPIESTLRVWDVFFYEGSRTLFRISLAIFKLGESEIKAMSDPMEMFGVVQSIPRRIIDANLLMETCFKRRSGFGHLTADVVEEKRLERRVLARSERERLLQAAGTADLKVQVAGVAGDLASGESGFGDTVRRKGTLFGRKKQLERPRLAEI